MTDLLETFQREGYVKLPGFVSGETLDELQKRVVKFVDNVAPTMPREHVFYEDVKDPSTLKQIQRIAENDSYFQTCLDGPFGELAEQLLEVPVRAVNLQYFNKPARVGKATPPHQDGYYFMLKPCEALTMWLALDEVDEQNGCVRYIPGSHLEALRPHRRTSTLGFSQGIADYGTDDDLRREVATTASPGDLLVHHALTIHRADANESPTRSRRALGAVFYSQRAEQDAEAHRVYQDKLRQEMLDRGEI